MCGSQNTHMTSHTSPAVTQCQRSAGIPRCVCTNRTGYTSQQSHTTAMTGVNDYSLSSPGLQPNTLMWSSEQKLKLNGALAKTCWFGAKHFSEILGPLLRGLDGKVCPAVKYSGPPFDNLYFQIPLT